MKHGGRCLALICCLLATVANAQPPGARAAAVAATPSAPTTAAEPAKSVDRRIVITIDDLPWASFGDSAWPVEEGKSIPPRVAEAHQRLIADFLDAVEGGRQPQASARSALAIHALIDAMLESSRRGAPVDVAEVG